MNKIQKIILAILIPLILVFLSIIIIQYLSYIGDKGVPALIVIVITLIIITIYEYDLFGKNIIINILTSKAKLKDLLFILVIFGILFVISRLLN
jgi:hypothetical protein